ncbi:MAG: hypothetical protein KGL39_56570 [Patescibacteria group bacterium]|nr:hypothetical protein [Patescibacteria group bacterium]
MADAADSYRVVELPGERTLAFSKPKQEALLGHLLFDHHFFAIYGLRVQPEWFQDPYCSKVYKLIMGWYRRYKRPPSRDELLNSREVLAESQFERNRTIALVTILESRTQEFRADALSHELTAWLKAEIFKRGAYEAAAAFNDEDVDKAVARTQVCLRDVQKASFDDNLLVQWNDLTAYDRATAELQNALTFGHPVIDHIITPIAASGSLLKGDSTIILAPTNTGKTTCLITIAVANAKANKKVLYIPHEGRDLDLRNKIQQAFLRRSLYDLMSLIYRQKGYDGAEVQAQFTTMINRVLPTYLHFMPMHKLGLTVEDLCAAIRRQQESEILATGTGYDLIVDDYLAKLGGEGLRGRAQKRDVIAHAYSEAFTLNEELGTHIVTAIQTNRTGSKINSKLKGFDEKRLIHMEDVEESWEPMQLATNVLSINRDALAEAKGFVTFFHCKSRSSQKGYAICCRSQYDCATTHAPDLEAIYYRGDASLSEKMEQWLLQYDGGKVKKDPNTGALTNFAALRVPDEVIAGADATAVATSSETKS